MKIAVGVVSIVGAVLSSTSDAAFKCVSPAGKVSFQDLPCEKDSASKELKVERAPATAPVQNKAASSSADQESATMERQVARSACGRAQSKWDTTLTALESLVAKNPEADKRAEGMESVARMRQKNREIDLDKCAEKYMSDPS